MGAGVKLSHKNWLSLILRQQQLIFQMVSVRTFYFVSQDSLACHFRFDEASVVYHDEARDGLVRVCRLALYQKYPKYATEGFEALYSRPPVIYLSSASKPGLSHYLCLQVSSPESV